MTDHHQHIDPNGTGQIQLVTFGIHGEEFGVDILKVQEIIRLMEITSVPSAQNFVSSDKR